MIRLVAPGSVRVDTSRARSRAAGVPGEDTPVERAHPTLLRRNPATSSPRQIVLQIALLSVMASPLHGQRSQVDLEEIASLRIPAFLAREAVLALDEERVAVTDTPAGRIHLLGFDGAHDSLDVPEGFDPIGVWRTDANGWEVIGAHDHRLWRIFPRDGRSEAVLALPEGGERPQGASGTEGWWILVPDTVSGHSILHRVDTDGSRELLTLPLPPPSRRPTGAPGAHLSLGEDEVYLTETVPPYRIHAVDRRNGSHRSFTPGFPEERIEEILPDGRVSGLVPLRILDIGRGRMLLTVANLGSDRRLMLSMDREGTLLSDTIIDLPMGFLAAYPESCTILAVMDLGEIEVVKYRMTFRGSTGQVEGTASGCEPSAEFGPGPP